MHVRRIDADDKLLEHQSEHLIAEGSEMAIVPFQLVVADKMRGVLTNDKAKKKE